MIPHGGWSPAVPGRDLKDSPSGDHLYLGGMTPKDAEGGDQVHFLGARGMEPQGKVRVAAPDEALHSRKDNHSIYAKAAAVKLL